MKEHEFRSGVLDDGTRLMQPPLRCQRLVVIESPYAGEVERNLAYARACMADSLDRGEFPFASHLLYTQPGVLDDNDPADRALGIEAGFEWARHASAAVFYTDLGMSRGMVEAVKHWEKQGMLIVERQLPADVFARIPVSVTCGACGGNGKTFPAGLRPCPCCKGSGRVMGRAVPA